MKIEFSSQRREMLLFLTTNMAAVTSRANQQLFQKVFLVFSMYFCKTKQKKPFIYFYWVVQLVQFPNTYPLEL